MNLDNSTNNVLIPLDSWTSGLLEYKLPLSGLIIRKFFLAYTQIEVRQFRDILIQHIEYVKKSIEERALHTREYVNGVNERKMQIETHVSSSRFRNDTHAEDAIIISENDKQPMAEKVCQDTCELEHSVAKLLAENEKLHKENEHLKQTYKDLYNSIKKTRVQTKDHNNSLIAQINVTPHYLPKVQEYVLTKPHHVIAPGSSKNSKKESYGSNDMAHNHYLEEARKKTQERNRSSKPSVMHTTSLQNTTNGSKQKPRSNNQTSRSFPVSKSSSVTSNSVPLVDHSRNSSSFLDCKHFICSTCQKFVFNGNHDAYLMKFLKEANYRVKIQSPKTRDITKPVVPMSHTQKPGRQIVTGHWFSPNKSFDVHEKTNTPRSCLRWIPTGRIFYTAGLRWVPTGKKFISSITKVDCEPPNGSNEDVTNPYECNQTINVSAGTLNLSAGTSFNPKKERPGVCLMKRVIYQKPRVQGIYI
ncbi:hypothetical protein Tco_0298817 [Tanacetum coccineum]